MEQRPTTYLFTSQLPGSEPAHLSLLQIQMSSHYDAIVAMWWAALVLVFFAATRNIYSQSTVYNRKADKEGVL